jgi:hypothetical protein
VSDIATLGLAVDSTQVVSATTALDQFASAAKPASDAAAALQNTAAGVSTAMKGVGPAALVAADGSIAAADGVAKLAASARPAVVALADLEATLNAAVGDQIVMATAQKNGTTINDAHSESLRGQRMVLRGLASDLAIFGTGVGQYAGLAGMMYYENMHVIEGFGGLKSAIGSILTPTNLLIGGVAALVVGGYALVTSVVAQEKAFDDLAVRSDSTLRSIHALESAASFKGVDTADFLKQMETLAPQVNLVSSGLNTMFRANKVDADDLNGSVLVLADLIKNAASESDRYKLIQEAGLPATRQWVEFLSQGSVGIKAAQGNAVALGTATDQNLINKARAFDEALTTAWKNFKDNASAAVIESAGWLDQLGPKISSLWVNAFSTAEGRAAAQRQIASALLATGHGTDLSKTDPSAIYKGFPAFDGSTATGPNGKPTKSTIDPDQVKADIQQYQQLMGLLGPLASIDQVIAQKENDITLARLAGVDVTKKQEQAILAYAQAQALGIVQIHSQTDALGVESSTFAMTAGQAAAYAAVQTKINEANRTGNPLTQTQINLIRQEAVALGDATERMDEMRTANEALSSGFKTFRQDMENGTNGWTALKDAAMTALNSIADKLIDMASKNLVAAAFGGSSGSGSILGLITGLFGKGGGTAPGDAGIAGQIVATQHTGGVVGTDATDMRYVHPSYFDDAPRFHGGGIAADEVPIIAKAGEGVFTAAQMAKLAPTGGASTLPPVNIYQTNDFRGTDPSSIARINAALVQTKNAAVKEAITGIMNLQKNAPGVMRPQG